LTAVSSAGWGTALRKESRVDQLRDEEERDEPDLL